MKNFEQTTARGLLRRRNNGGKTAWLGKQQVIAYTLWAILILIALLILIYDESGDNSPFATFIIGITLATFLRDIRWFRAIEKSWPLTEKWLDWSKVEAAAKRDNKPPPMPESATRPPSSDS